MSEYIQLAATIGNHSIIEYKMYQDDFYTLCLKNPKDNLGLRKKSNFKHNEVIFKQQDTNLEYLCSDFVRFCLSIYKINCSIPYGEMSLIPKSPIPISKELREYMKEFLPDFYGIRK